MQTALLSVLLYLAAGAAFFAHPSDQATPADFSPRGQLVVFTDTFLSVLTWPVALWHMLQS